MTEKDTTTYDLIKDIKSDEEQHVKDLADLALEHGYISR
jgi:bacterioferritin (cytochrome b1)